MPSPAPEWSVYLVRCRDGSIYTGIAKDVARRVRMHNSGRGAKYTRTRGPVAVIHTEAGFSHGDALRRERLIKGWTRKRKLALATCAQGVPA